MRRNRSNDRVIQKRESEHISSQSLLRPCLLLFAALSFADELFTWMSYMDLVVQRTMDGSNSSDDCVILPSYLYMWCGCYCFPFLPRDLLRIKQKLKAASSMQMVL